VAIISEQDREAAQDLESEERMMNHILDGYPFPSSAGAGIIKHVISIPLPDTSLQDAFLPSMVLTIYVHGDLSKIKNLHAMVAENLEQCAFIKVKKSVQVFKNGAERYSANMGCFEMTDSLLLVGVKPSGGETDYFRGLCRTWDFKIAEFSCWMTPQSSQKKGEHLASLSTNLAPLGAFLGLGSDFHPLHAAISSYPPHRHENHRTDFLGTQPVRHLIFPFFLFTLIFFFLLGSKSLVQPSKQPNQAKTNFDISDLPPPTDSFDKVEIGCGILVDHQTFQRKGVLNSKCVNFKNGEIELIAPGNVTPRDPPSSPPPRIRLQRA
jgi:hypothetical protein